MTLRRFHLRSPLALFAVAPLLCIGTPALSQNASGQNNATVQDNDTARQELMSLDQFLDSHPEIAEQIHRDPSLVNNDVFLKNHPTLRNYLDDHPGVQKEINEDRDAFASREMLHARRVDVGMRDHDGDVDGAQDRDQDQGHTRQQLAEFDKFLDSHKNIAADLRQNPWLATNYEYLQAHPELKDYLKSHPDVQQQLMKNPQTFVSSSQKFSTGTTSTGTTGKSPSTTTTPPTEPKSKQ